ncbi:hypothetical protein [Kurthia sp. Dielmo]|uniref:hypothetical protein n=1 Tax=Kurthia sp. Dielmo TaxID=1033738 RepID=UPI0003000B2C|nr:hypothetical protein [Kurthia sp. Dielmo]
MLYTMLKKIVNAKTYNQAEITKRVNTFFAVGQLEDAEYRELIAQIETVYA